MTTTNEKVKKLIPIHEAADRLGVSKQTFKRLARSFPNFPTIRRLSERKLLVYEHELDEFMSALPEEVL